MLPTRSAEGQNTVHFEVSMKINGDLSEMGPAATTELIDGLKSELAIKLGVLTSELRVSLSAGSIIAKIEILGEVRNKKLYCACTL